MAFDLSEIEARINSIVGQSVTVTEGDADWVLRRSYINRAQKDWSERFDWQVLYKEVNSMTSQATGNATISLPTDFRKLATAPVFANGISAQAYAEIDPQMRATFNPSQNYSYVMGDPSNGYNLIVNPATLGSGASVYYSYYRKAPSLVSGSDVSLCPNPDYLVQQSLYYYFLANEDARFQDQRAQAENILANLLEFENTRGNGYNNEVPNNDITKNNFRWGRDG